MKKEWFFDRYCGQQFVALLEDGKLAEFAAEKETGGEIAGNVYKGRVMNVLSGMQAAFVSCGLERNCYLSLADSYADYTKYDGTMGGTSAQPHDWKPGDEIIVQVVQPPRGNKGAKVTTHLSFVGKNLIYLPNTDFVGISRKITEEELRKNLLFTAEKMRERQDEGFIVRTQAPFVNRRQLKREAEYLRNLWRDTAEQAKNAPVGAVLHKECDLPVRVMRDSMGEDVSAMYVGDRELYERLLRLVRLRGDFPERKVVLYTGERGMFRSYGISPLVYEAAQPRVELDSGGTLVIDHTEAMTVVDVNSGSFVGEKNMEETALNVNLEAAREIARQVRLRNIGGIVVVDFIDMAEEEHRLRVTAELTARLAGDKAKCRVLPMSDLCLTQFTRKRVVCTRRRVRRRPYPRGYSRSVRGRVRSGRRRTQRKGDAADPLRADVRAGNERALEGQAHLYDSAQDVCRRAVFGARGQFGRPAPPRQRAGTLLSAAGEGIGEMSR